MYYCDDIYLIVRQYPNVCFNDVFMLLPIAYCLCGGIAVGIIETGEIETFILIKGLHGPTVYMFKYHHDQGI